MRPVLVLLHRYVGLATALFLFLAGLTGSLLAFHHEIDEWLNPGFYAVGEGGERLSPGSLVQRVESRYPRQLVWYMEYPEAGGHPALLATVPREAGAKVEHDVFYLDPVSGEEVGKRLWAACCFQPANLVPWVLEFHHNLTLPGNWGLYLMGGVAMFWFLDCFVGAWLTLPRGRPFWSKWTTAWKIKRGNAYRFNFDLHRAGGLWLWLLLAPVALSSVALNLPSQVFKPLVSLFSPIEPSVYEARGRLPRSNWGRPAWTTTAPSSWPASKRRGWASPSRSASCTTASNTTSSAPASATTTTPWASPGCSSTAATAACSARKSPGRAVGESASTACSTRSTAGASPACRDASPSPPSAWPSPGYR